MSRSGYSDNCDGWVLICWRGAVASAIRGRRGQAFLRELRAALDALERPELIENDLASDEGVCAIGAVLRARGVDVSAIDPDDREQVAAACGIAPALAAEIAFVNDERWLPRSTTDTRFDREARWALVSEWVDKRLGTSGAGDPDLEKC